MHSSAHLRRRSTVIANAALAAVLTITAAAPVAAQNTPTATPEVGNSQSTAGNALVVGPNGLMSISSARTPTTAPGASGAAISGDGSRVAFSSAANSLDRQPNDHLDIFVRDRAEGVTDLASRSFDGTPSNGDSFDARLSADGRFVGFTSAADNLVSRNGRDSTDTNKVADAFVYDLRTGITRLVSRKANGSQHTVGSRLVDISDDGQRVLVARSTGTGAQLEVVDWVDNTVIPIDASVFGIVDKATVEASAALSGDGTRVVFLTTDSYSDVDTDDERDVYGVDVASGRITLLTRTNDIGTQLALSANGTFAVFAARRDGGGFGVYRQELRSDLTPTGSPLLVSVDTLGSPVDSPASALTVSINRDGSTVAFTSTARVIAEAEPSSGVNVFVRRVAGASSVTFRASLERHGFPLDGDSTKTTNARSISDNGRAIAFTSTAAMVSGDANGVNDVFVATPAITCNERFVSVFLSSGERPTEGNDVILGTRRADRIDALGGNDTVCGGDGDDFILGGTGHDVLFGDDGDDVIEGGTGRDLILGHAGADKLYGDDGKDRIYGGDGDDLLSGNAGKDLLMGEAGNDRMLGGKGRDTLNGGGGDDNMSGGGSKDFLLGKAGDDTLSGGTGRDSLRGGKGNDRIDGGDDADRINGGSGTDDCAVGAADPTDKLTACE